MKILKVEVDWMEKFANDPYWIVYVDELPPYESLAYHKYDSGHYVSERTDGHVNFLHWQRPGEGFGGRMFKLILDDGSQVQLKGPWSSRAGSINLWTPHKVADCTYRTMEGRGGGIAGAICIRELMTFIFFNRFEGECGEKIGATWIENIDRRKRNGRYIELVEGDKVLMPMHRDPESGRMWMKESSARWASGSRHIYPVDSYADLNKLGLVRHCT